MQVRMLMNKAIKSRTKKALDRMIVEITQGANFGQGYIDEVQRIFNDEHALAIELSHILGVSFALRVDGYGAFYATMHQEEQDGTALINIFPPIRLWNGDTLPLQPELSDTHWHLIIGGEHVGSTENMRDLADLMR